MYMNAYTDSVSVNYPDCAKDVLNAGYACIHSSAISNLNL